MTRIPLILLSAYLLIVPQVQAADLTDDTAASPASSSPASATPPQTNTPLAQTAPTPEQTADAVVQEEPVADLWQRLRAGMDLPEMNNDLVANDEQWFASRPRYMSATLQRARLYLFHIVDEVDKRHMPMEIALLPMIESAYNPQAESPSDATGIWQFLPGTGKHFGLKQNGWYDGRRDIVNATRAALDYLQRLHDMFNDWELALAAYNCGEGCVSRAIAKNRARGLSTDYISLDLPPQTRNYVPRLLAIRNVIREPERFGVDLNEIPNAPAFRKVTLSYPIEAKTAAKLAEMSPDDFLALNPGFRRKVIYAESQSTLLLPPDKIDTFNRNLAATESSDIRLHTFQAPKGALLSRIASRFDVTIQWLKDHNPLTVKHGKLAQTQTLMLPPTTGKVALEAKSTTLIAANSPHEQAGHDKVRVHTVRKGETLYSLARLYKVKIADILELNGPLKILRPGRKIHIPIDG
jgi:membrane-bound lytic murein transglycosylase D